MSTPRSDVYKAIDSEREYQNSRWSRTPADVAAGHNPHSLVEWFTYMKSYTNEALEILSRNGDPEEASQMALPFARKVAALGVVAMEQHGAPLRGA